MKNKHKGSLEYTRFEKRRSNYYASLSEFKKMQYEMEDIIEHFPAFVGHMTISRFLGLYELYNKTLGVAGHIAEVGIYKGASFLFLAKLVKIFESESLVQVHGFDWFKGMGKDDLGLEVEIGTYKESFERINKLIEIQDIGDIAKVHKMDVTKDLKLFFKKHKHLQFKLVFLDAGTYKVVKSVLPLFWERLTAGGIIILDQYNHELSPGETMAVREILPNAKVKTLQNIWMPTAYIIKE